MNTSPLRSITRAVEVSFTDDMLVVHLHDGRIVSVPLSWFPRLLNASNAERVRFEFLGEGSGIHWPLIDEDISVDGLLAGNASAEIEVRKR